MREREGERASQPKHAGNNLLNISQPGRGRRLMKSCHDSRDWKSPDYTKQIQFDVKIPVKTALFSRNKFNCCVFPSLHSSKELTTSYSVAATLLYRPRAHEKPKFSHGIYVAEWVSANPTKFNCDWIFYNAIRPLEFLNLTMVLNDEIFVGSNGNHFVTDQLDSFECFRVAEAQMETLQQNPLSLDLFLRLPFVLFDKALLYTLYLLLFYTIELKETYFLALFTNPLNPSYFQ